MTHYLDRRRTHSNLDSRSADEVFEIFNGLVEQGKTILMVTHDPTLAQRTHEHFCSQTAS